MTREERTEYNRKWRAANPEKVAKYSENNRKWRAAHPEKVAEYTARRRERAQTHAASFVSNFLSSIHASAKKRNIECDLTKEQLMKLFVESNGKCAMTGAPLTIKFGSPYRASVDRVDNSKGYTYKNLQITTARVNLVMRDVPKHEFIALCRAVVTKHKGK